MAGGLPSRSQHGLRLSRCGPSRWTLGPPRHLSPSMPESALLVASGCVALRGRRRRGPGRRGRGVPDVQKIERLAGLTVDEHGAVVLSASGGEVVDARHFRDGPVRIGQGHKRPQERRPAHPCVQDRGQTAPSPAAECDGDSLQNPPGGRCPAAIANGQALDPLGESTPRTTNVLAVQPSHRQLDQYRPIPDRRIGKASSVRAVHPVGHNRTPRAGRLCLSGPRHHVNRSALEENALHQQLAEVRKQVTDEIITPNHDPR